MRAIPKTPVACRTSIDIPPRPATRASRPISSDPALGRIMLNPYTQEPAHVGGGPEGFGFDRFLRAFFDRSQLISLEKPLASAQSAVWALFFVNVRSRENLAEIPRLPSWNKTVFVVMGKKNRKYFAIVRYRLRWFSFLLLALWANLVTAQTGQNSSIYRRASAPIATPSREQEIAGSEISAIAASDQAGRAERMVTASLAGLARAESIQARIRQRVVFSGRLIVGAGTYVQSGIGSEQRFRFESTLKGDTEQFVLQEISDGIVFWTYRKNSTDAPSIERIDIRRVRCQRISEEVSGRLPWFGNGFSSRRQPLSCLMVCRFGKLMADGIQKNLQFFFLIRRRQFVLNKVCLRKQCQRPCLTPFGSYLGNETSFRFESNYCRYKKRVTPWSRCRFLNSLT